MSNQAVFDEEASKQLETLYRIGDVVRRRGLVRSSLAAAPGRRPLLRGEREAHEHRAAVWEPAVVAGHRGRPWAVVGPSHSRKQPTRPNASQRSKPQLRRHFRAAVQVSAGPW